MFQSGIVLFSLSLFAAIVVFMFSLTEIGVFMLSGASSNSCCNFKSPQTNNNNNHPIGTTNNSNYATNIHAYTASVVQGQTNVPEGHQSSQASLSNGAVSFSTAAEAVSVSNPFTNGDTDQQLSTIADVDNSYVMANRNLRLS